MTPRGLRVRTGMAAGAVLAVAAVSAATEAAVATPDALAKLTHAPAGYSWAWCKSTRANFLLPEGWSFKEDEAKDSGACYLTKESIGKEGRYRTGMSINVVHGSRKPFKGPAEVYTRGIIEQLQAKSGESWSVGPWGDWTRFKGYGGFFRNDVPTLGPVIQGTWVVANESTGSLYVIVIEGPADQWESPPHVGEIANTIMGNLMLDAAL